jgi:hypothetical protein
MSLDIKDNLVDCRGNLNTILPLLQVWQVVDGHNGVSRIIHGDDCRVEGTKKMKKIQYQKKKHEEFYVLGK